jgi:hypothetical protein
MVSATVTVGVPASVSLELKLTPLFPAEMPTLVIGLVRLRLIRPARARSSHLTSDSFEVGVEVVLWLPT